MLPAARPAPQVNQHTHTQCCFKDDKPTQPTPLLCQRLPEASWYAPVLLWAHNQGTIMSSWWLTTVFLCITRYRHQLRSLHTVWRHRSWWSFLWFCDQTRTHTWVLHWERMSTKVSLNLLLHWLCLTWIDYRLREETATITRSVFLQTWYCSLLWYK